MDLSSHIVKQISMERDKLFEVILGGSFDEYGQRYSEVYQHELNGFFRSLEYDLSLLEDNSFIIDKMVLKSQIIINWFTDFKSCDGGDLDNYINDVLFKAKKGSTLLNLDLEDSEMSFIKELLSQEINNSRKLLINLIVSKDDDTTKFLELLKEEDGNRFNHLVESMKNNYITSVNILYKLYNEQPKDWQTNLSLHESVCNHFNINRESFLF